MVDPTFGLYFSVIQTLERLDAPYVIIGAFAGMSYGVTRLTADMDIVVNLAEGTFKPSPLRIHYRATMPTLDAIRGSR